jgi:hypothetical protein
MAVNNLNSGVGIQPTIVDAKGDLIAATANDAVNRLAVGTNGQVLVADSGETTGLKWNNPGTVGGLVHIETRTASASAAEIFNNVFSATYINYLVLLQLTGSGSIGIDMRLRAGGTDNSSAQYRRQTLESTSTTTSSSRNTGDTSWVGLLAADSSQRNVTALQVFQPFETQHTAALSTRLNAISGNIEFRYVGHGISVTTSYDGFSLIATSGNFTGTINVYGYKK